MCTILNVKMDTKNYKNEKILNPFRYNIEH